MGNLFNKDGFKGWIPREDAVNADPGVLLRADNCVLDEEGAVILRPGTTLYQGSIGSGNVNDILTCTLRIGDGAESETFSNERKNFYTTDNAVYLDSDVLKDMTEEGEDGNIAIGHSMYNVFFARGAGKYRYDGKSVVDWTPERPTLTPTLTAVNPVSSEVSYCNASPGAGEISDTWDLTTVKEGTIAYAVGSGGVANTALSLTPVSATGRAMANLTYTARQNLQEIQSYPENDDDLLDMLIYVEEPERLKWVMIQFGCSTSATAPFGEDRYEYRWTLTGPVDIKEKKLKRIEADTIDISHDPQTLPDPEEIETSKPKKVIDIPHSHDKGPRSKLPEYKTGNSPNWVHLSVPRGHFDRIGSTDGRDWGYVKAVRIIAQFMTGTSTEIRVDNIIIVGGGGRAYTGKYKVRCCPVVKNNENKVIAIGPPTSSTNELEAFQKAIKVTVPYAIFPALTGGATHMWYFMYGGGLDDWYRVAETGVTPSDSGMTLSEFAPTADGTIDKDDKHRWISRRFTYPDGVDENPDLELTLLTSEIDALIANYRMPRGLCVLPNDVIAIEGPYKNRMVALTGRGHVYFSQRDQHGTFSRYWTRVTDASALWLKATPSGLYIGTRRDVYRIVGEGTYIDPYTIDFTVRPLNIAHPPIDDMVYAEQDSLVYRSADGLIQLAGESISPFNIDDIEPLWRNVGRHEVEPLNIASGRFRVSVDNKIFYMLAPEGESTSSSNVIYRFNFVTQKWSRSVYPFSIRTLYRDDEEGRVLAGTTDGRVIQIDNGDDDLGLGYIDLVEIWSPYSDGGNPLAWKDAFDFVIGVDTGGQPVTIDLYDQDDVSGTPSATFPVTTNDYEAWRENVSASLTEFRLVQMRLSGAPAKLRLRLWNISYRPRPQHMMVLDTGDVPASPNGDMSHVHEVEITCKADYNFTVTPYFDGVAGTTRTVTASPGVVTTYRVLFERGSIGRTVRVKLASTAPAGTGELGLEVYQVTCWTYLTGNKHSRTPRVLYPMRDNNGA